MSLYISKSARIALKTLRDIDREKLSKLLEEIQASPPTIHHLYKAKKLPGIQDTFLLQISHQLRAIIVIQDDKIQLLEIVKHDSLKRVFSSLRKRGGAE